MIVPDHRNALLTLLAHEIDFGADAHAALEQYFLLTTPASLCSNPHVSPGALNALLAMVNDLPADTVMNLVARHTLSAAQREVLYRGEKRFRVWTQFIKSQVIDARDVDRLLTLRLGTTACDELLRHYVRLDLASHPRFAAVLEQASPSARLRYLLASGATTPTQMGEWVAQYVIGMNNVGADLELLAQALVVRPELIDFMLELPAREAQSVAAQVLLASTRLSVDQQVANLRLADVAGPDDPLCRAAPVPDVSAYRAAAWFLTYARVAQMALLNPYTGLVVVEAIRRILDLATQDHLECTGMTDAAEMRAARHTLALRDRWPHALAPDVAPGDLTTESDVRAVVTFVEQVGTHDVLKLKSNVQHLYSMLDVTRSSALTKSDARLLVSVRRTMRSRLRRELDCSPRTHAVAKVLYNTAAVNEIAAEQVCGGVHRTPVTRLSRACAALESFDPQVVVFSGWGFNAYRARIRHQTSAMTVYVMQTLGVDPDMYATLATLSANWSGSLEELCQTAAALGAAQREVLVP